METSRPDELWIRLILLIMHRMLIGRVGTEESDGSDGTVCLLLDDVLTVCWWTDVGSLRSSSRDRWPSLGLLVLVSCNERGRSYCTESPYTGFGGYLEYVSIARSNIMVHYLPRFESSIVSHKKVVAILFEMADRSSTVCLFQKCMSSASPTHDSMGVRSQARLCKQAI